MLELREKEGTPKDAGVTAAAFLTFLICLRRIILQDAAAMLILHPERADHVFFKDSLFTSEEFLSFKEEMAAQFEKREAPMRATVEEAMPGVSRRFDLIEDSLKDLKVELKQVDQRVGQGFFSAAEFQERVEAAAQVLATTDGAQGGDDDGRKGGSRRQQQAREDDRKELERASKYRLLPSFMKVEDMVDCWFGRGQFEGMPVDGGVEEAENRWPKGRWRKDYNAAETKYFSRVKSIVSASKDAVERQKDLTQQWCVKKSLAGLVKYCQDQGWTSKKARKSSRSRRAGGG